MEVPFFFLKLPGKKRAVLGVSLGLIKGLTLARAGDEESM